jgi:two-component system nitrogen regulation response regulator GlnG
VNRKEFREDLFHRLSGFRFHLKPLEERKADIEVLVRYFQKSSPRKFFIQPEAFDILRSYKWPGNIRELKKVCQRLALNENGIINAEIVSKMLLVKETSVKDQSDWENVVLKSGLKSYISFLEKKAVELSLRRNNGKITACIKELKISSSAFYRIMNENQITV